MRKILLGCVTAIAWSALLLQLWATISAWHARGLSTADALTTYLSYFTVLTNILVALALSAMLSNALTPGVTAAGADRFIARFSSPFSAVALYIAVVGVSFSLLLRHVWETHGIQLAANILLHDVTPVVYVLTWWFVTPRASLRWSAAWWWTLYPLGYFGAMLARGSATGFYPYHFLDLRLLGWPGVIRNAGLFTVAFLALGFGLIALNRAAGYRPRIQAA